MQNTRVEKIKIDWYLFKYNKVITQIKTMELVIALLFLNLPISLKATI